MRVTWCELYLPHSVNERASPVSVVSVVSAADCLGLIVVEFAVD